MDNKDKWIEFKNYLHNELGITNDQIREWVKESVEVQVEKLLKQEFGKFSLSDYIVKTLRSFMTKTKSGYAIYEENAYDGLKREITDKLSKMLYQDISISKRNLE